MPAKVNLTGQVFGRLTVIGEGKRRTKSGNVYWLCRCECGTVREFLGRAMRTGDAKSCGCSQYYTGKQVKDLTGRKFGWLTVKSFSHAGEGGSGAHWFCRCDCGNEKVVRACSLVTGATTSCGCYRPNRAADLTGRRFGRLIVTGRSSNFIKRRGADAQWRCRCDCGGTTVVLARSLVHGNTASCGCIARSADGKSRTREYRSTKEGVRRGLKRKSGGTFSHQQIERLYSLQRGRCAICRAPVPLTKIARDHVVPLALGGTNDISNIQVLCRPCNCRKSAKHPIDFMQQRGFLL